MNKHFGLSRSLTLGAFVAACVALPAHSASLINPSFEIPALNGGYQYNPSAAGIGWTFVGSGGITVVFAGTDPADKTAFIDAVSIQ